MKQRLKNRETFKTLKWNSIALFIALLLNHFFYDSLFALSTELSYQLQQNFSFEYFSYFFSAFLFYFLFLVQQFWIFLFRFKKDAIFYSLTLYVCVSVSSLMKMIMKEHRPSFVDVRLIQRNKHFCENDYGMPSSHTFLTVLLSCFFFQQLRRNIDFMSQKTNYMINIGIMGMIAFTRVYLGVHTFMQILIGGLLAIEVYLLVEHFKSLVIQKVLEPILFK